jgi:TetR/AcrR family transcriptional regulator, transcriptional repressor for nem operon
MAEPRLRAEMEEVGWFGTTRLRLWVGNCHGQHGKARFIRSSGKPLTAYPLVGILSRSAATPMNNTRHESKTKFLDAALHVIRCKGYTATRVEDICAAAELTKGSFFHHFDTKEELALAAAAYWGTTTAAFFEAAPYRAEPDPLARLLAYVDFRKAILQGELPEFTCLVGTMVQEVYSTHPAIRVACDKTISEHAATLEADIAECMRLYGVTEEWTASSLALYIQAVIQGAFILAKAKGGPAVAADCIDHLRRYLKLLFAERKPQGENTMPTAKKAVLCLTEVPEVVNWPETHYVFIEKVGPFPSTAQQAWQQLHPLVPKLLEQNKITGYMSLYKVAPQIYRAGLALAAPPEDLPGGLTYEKFPGGKYSRFVLTGPYANLPEACSRVFQIVAEARVPLRDDFGIENYISDPRITPEEQLVTQILVPTA